MKYRGVFFWAVKEGPKQNKSLDEFQVITEASWTCEYVWVTVLLTCEMYNTREPLSVV